MIERRDTSPEAQAARTAWVREQSLKAGGWPARSRSAASGHPTKEDEVITGYYKCTNSNCDSCGVTQELDVVVEQDTGAKYLLHEDEVYCQDCGHEMEDED